MANANRVDDEIKSFNELESHVFSHAKGFGMERWADTDDPAMTYPTRYFEEEAGVQELIDEYDDEHFWDELCERLGERDFDERYTKEEQKTMDRDERVTKLYEAIGKWDDELVAYGLKRLRVLDMTLQTKGGAKKK